MASGDHIRAGAREIASPSNSLVKVFRRALATGTTRDGWLAVEGPHLVEEALAASNDGGRNGAGGVAVRSVLVARGGRAKFEGLIRRLPPDSELAEVPDRLFQQIAQTEAPQGIAALVELGSRHLDSALARQDAVVLVACGLQDPGNLGAMMRSADALCGAFGAALVTLPGTVHPFNPKSVRSSAGAVFRLPVFPGADPAAFVARARASGVRLIAAERRAPLPVASADLRGPIALLIGQEAAGLPESFAAAADLRVSIPLHPAADSLNAATAAGILLYEAARQRAFGTRSPGGSPA